MNSFLEIAQTREIRSRFGARSLRIGAVRETCDRIVAYLEGQEGVEIFEAQGKSIFYWT